MGRNQSLEAKMQSHKTLIENTIGTPAIQEEVTLYSYTPEKMGEGKALFDATAALFTNQETETAEKEDATDDFNLMRNEIDDQLARDIKLARVALREDPTLLRSYLGVKGMRSSVYTEWRKQVKQFYSNALSKEDLTISQKYVHNFTYININRQFG